MWQSAGPPILVKRVEAAQLLGISVTELDRLRYSGRLMAKKQGRRVLFPTTELERYAESLPWEADLRT
ncbi:MAG: helix-turn-helix domain-containing protein [Mycobacterium sp.]|nr:helix-turn-helix domain-containing protein [Mycobacterium sp.]